MKIILGSDHGGFDLKEDLKIFIGELGHTCADYGTYSREPVDYPDVACLVALAVSRNEGDLGIVLDGAGIGSAIAANKIPGIRAAVCNDLFTARNSREHNDANILALGGNVVGKGMAREIVRIWLSCGFLGTRHARRVKKIVDIERRFWLTTST